MNFALFRSAASMLVRNLLPGPRDRLLAPFCLCLAALLLLGSWFVSSVLSRPAKTPIVTLTANYGPEWDLNAWVAEDTDAITRLGNHTCSVTPLPDVDQLASGFWDTTDDLLKTSLANASDSAPMIVYANLHGAVNDEGVACWIPPSGQVKDASTWFPISNLLDHVERCQPRDEPRPIVMLLECGRLRSHWAAGIAENRFCETLSEMVGEHQRKYPNSRLLVINSTAKGERSLYSRLGDGDVFTRFASRGLAGEADGYGTDGKADGVVNSEELIQFVSDRVSCWALSHRGTSQTPTVHQASSTGPIPLVRVARRYDRTSAAKTPPPGKTEREKLRAASDSISALYKEDPISVNVHALAQIHRTMHAIEQSVFGGVAVRKSTDRWYSRLNRQLQNLKQEIRLRESESTQLIDVQMNRKAAIIWSALEKQPTQNTASSLVSELTSDRMLPVPMLNALLRRPELSFWKKTDLVSRTAKSQSQWLATTLVLPDAMFPAVEHVSNQVHVCRRRLADQILASGSEPIVGSQHPVMVSLRQFESQVSKRTKMLKDLSLAWRARKRSFLELPFLYQSIEDAALVTRPGANPSKLLQLDANQPIQGGLDDVMRLDSLLVGFVNQSQPWDDSMHDQLTMSTERVSNYLKRLSGVHEQMTQATAGRPGGVTANSGDSPRASTAQDNWMLPDPVKMMQDEAMYRRIDQKHVRSGAEGSATRVTRKPIENALGLNYLATLLGVEPESATPPKIRKKLREMSAVEPGQTVGQRWRRVVSLIISDEFSEVIHAARSQSRQRRLASNAAETLDDFWHNPVQNNRPYFVATAQSLLTAAQSSSNETPDWKTRQRELQARLHSRQMASDRGLSINACWKPTLGGDGASEVTIAFERPDQDQIPVGTGVVSVRPPMPQNRPVQGSIDLSLQKQKTASLNLVLTSKLADGSVAEIDFRGNLYRAPVVSSGKFWGVSATQAPATKDTSVTVHNGLGTRRAFSFVLDCSASMVDPVGTETIRSQSNHGNKFDAARSALFEMMRRLRPRGVEVGLVLYGHRMAIGSGEQGLLIQKRYHQRFPFSATIEPYEDVEVALPVGRFDSVELDLARQHFEAAVPWGQTPLYLAISKAIDDTSRLGKGVGKDVIVISDGRNYQFNPLDDAVVSPSELIVKAKRNGVRIHVIGFGVAEEELAAASTEFSVITQGTGGKSIADIDEATELLRQLEKLAEGETYSVRSSDGKTRIAKLGQTIQLSEITKTNSPVQIAVGDHLSTIPVSPNDHIKLDADPNVGSLTTAPYVNGGPQLVELVSSDGRRLPQRVGIETPKMFGHQCRFRVSVQRSDRMVAKRPELMWAEVSPAETQRLAIAPALQQTAVSGRGELLGYRTSHFHWVPGKPCPVAEFVCQDWPDETDQYQIQVWTVQRAPAAQYVDGDTLGNGKTKLQLVDFPGIECQFQKTAEGVEVEMTYQQGSAANRDAMLIVKLDQRSVQSSDHWYDEDGKRSFHKFKFEEHSNDPSDWSTQKDGNDIVAIEPVGGKSLPRGNIRLKLWRISQIKEQGHRMPQRLLGNMVPNLAAVRASSTVPVSRKQATRR